MKQCWLQQQEEAFNRVHDILTFSVVGVSKACYCLQANSKPLFRSCTAREPSWSSSLLSRTTDKNVMFRWLKPSGMLPSFTNCCSNCSSGKVLRWHLTYLETFTRPWKWNKPNLAALNVEHYISYTLFSSSIRTPVNKVQKASGLS